MLAHLDWGRVLPGHRALGFVCIVSDVFCGRIRAEILGKRHYARTVDLSTRRTVESWLETEGVARTLETVVLRKETALGQSKRRWM